MSRKRVVVRGSSSTPRVAGDTVLLKLAPLSAPLDPPGFCVATLCKTSRRLEDNLQRWRPDKFLPALGGV